MKETIIYGTECKHWENCEFRNSIECDNIMCEEFELNKAGEEKNGRKK